MKNKIFLLIIIIRYVILLKKSHKHGLILDYSLEQNMVLQSYWKPKFQIQGFIRSKQVRLYANKLIKEYDIRSGEGAISQTRGRNAKKIKKSF